MKRLLASALAIGFAAAAAAQNNPQSTSAAALPPVQPPPDMDAPATQPAAAPTKGGAPIIPLANSDAEAQAAAAAEAQATAERAKALNSPNFTQQQPDRKALESPGLPPDVQKAAEATELPVVTVRQNGNERVEEYRKRGVLYFVRVVPQEGPPRYYVDRVSNVPQDLSAIAGPSGVIQPVYFKLFEWK
jgi:hypothetical protein